MVSNTIEQTNKNDWTKQAEVVSFDKVMPTKIEWLWPGKIPLGTLTLIAGDPGMGKSFLTLYMAAAVSAGHEWPAPPILDTGFSILDSDAEANSDSSFAIATEDRSSLVARGSKSKNSDSCLVAPSSLRSAVTSRDSVNETGSRIGVRDLRCAPSGSVIILNNEDSAERVIRPRLEAVGADLSKIKTIPFVRHKDKSGNEFTEYFNIITDLKELEAVIREAADTKMIIIDPLSAFFGCIDMHKDNYVRAIMTPIIELARKYNVAIVGVMHLNKGSSTKAIYRMMGSMALPASARAVWLVSGIPSNPGDRRRLFMPVKQNMMESAEAMAFTIKDNRVVFEEGPVNIPAEVALSPKSNMEAPERNRAIEWLKKLLADDKEMPSKEIAEMAAGEGFSEKTLRNAREEIGIKCFPKYDEEGNKFWCWKLHKEFMPPGLAEELERGRIMMENLNRSMAARMKR